MDVFYMYTYGKGAWLSLQALPLIASPKMIVAILLDKPREPSELEIYFARSFGFALITLAILSIVLTGTIPLTSSYSISADESDPKAPYAVPTLLVTSIFHAIAAFYAYTFVVWGGGVAFMIAIAAYGGLSAIACIGMSVNFDLEEREGAPIEMLPAEILDQIMSYLVVDIPPDGCTPRNTDLVSCLLTSRALHSATLSVLYRTITIHHSNIFAKALTQIRQYPYLGTFVRRLDFSPFTSIWSGRSQWMISQIQNLTSTTLLACLDLLPILQELLLQEHVENDLNADVLKKVMSGMPSLRAVDFCGCSSYTFSSGFVEAVTEDPDFPTQLPNLRRVSLHKCASLPDAAFRSLFPRLVNLTHLDVADTQITNSTLLLIPESARITHLNLSLCTRLRGAGVVAFLNSHPAVTDTLVYLNLMSDVSTHGLLEEEDVVNLLPHLTPTLRSLNLGGARITSAHMPMLLQLSKHLEELGLDSAKITINDINSFFIRQPASSRNESNSEWVHPKLRYLDLTRNPHITTATLLNTRLCVLATEQSFPLHVIELTERVVSPLRGRPSSNGWTVSKPGRRTWYVRQPPLGLPRPSTRRWWKLGVTWWGMRKIPVCDGTVSGLHAYYSFNQ
ncbi:hypothetical protein LOZ61_004054 [Ophidiomyces ophidiicola]|uniref:Uncharacterized protein n=1 Tax=Ophidiomyces ophidiicola TaxID=1387563 RepID=A0ACB8UXB8_9EURO|nr:hypothetical protein LOZ61_004054 [Ophidiomyces ophidiicola]KAI1931244.1 hypothetical protein LOZ60_000273 [Ophidiomyces ophidiicola]KAI1956762.1 hypothetical protein LOZ59_004178 [Ophidiomyces ophidiicola]KAI1974604.1 hypothetical protein LOZ56_001126 [Ophidiomyces ophidiicola]KAI2032440.1 hypothetical protein LOZ48_002413 [Ophidiomyces ophidiicola]